MKSIAGSIVVFGACVLIAAGASVSGDRGMYAMGFGTVLILFGLIITFRGTRDQT